MKSADPIFKGVVDYQTAVGDDVSTDLRLSEVHFRDGAVNRWHVHTCDQILVITEGEGTVADEIEERAVSAGDVVFIPKNTRHWHGARLGTHMTHWSILAHGKTTIVEQALEMAKTASLGSREVDAYIAAAPAAVRPMLRQLRATIKAAAPEATETISYRMPYYSHRGRLIYFALMRDWIGLYMLGRAKARYAKELRPYLSGASTARFSLDRPLPVGLVRRIVKERVAENEERHKVVGR